jgi:signal transduction histidine kinase
VAGVYAVAAAAYIVLSSRVAASLSRSLPELTHLEIVKGIVFVITTAGILFVVCLRLFSRIQRRERIIADSAAAAAEAERSALAGIFASALAHDINNSLSVSLAATEDVRRTAPADSERAVRRLQMSLESIRSLTSNLLELRSGASQDPITDFDLIEVLSSTVDFARHHRATLRCRIRLDVVRPTIRFTGRPELLRRAVLNMILNSAEATDRRGTIVVSAEGHDDGPVTVRVDDDGPGIPVDQRVAVLTPFHTTKPGGTGIGMLSVVACASDHDGNVQISESPLGGARIVLELRSVHRTD